MTGTHYAAPAVPATAVARPRIASLLDIALHQRLTMVVTPPGYGKTVLVSQWAASHPRQRMRWLTLRAEHDDTAAFFRELRAALIDDADHAPRGRLAVDPSSSLVDDLLDDLERLPPTTLVLDDFHALSDAALLDELATLVEHAPRSLQFVLVARSDPPLRYYRLGLTEALIELRQEDLRFDHDEASRLVRTVAGSDLGAAQIDALLARTEGWVAGLQLAALSLRGRRDVDEFIERFAGDDRHVADYLTEQVLERQSPDVHDFLLATSVLDRMSAPLCEFVTGTTGAHAMLDELDRRGVFISHVDGSRDWYR